VSEICLSVHLSVFLLTFKNVSSTHRQYLSIIYSPGGTQTEGNVLICFALRVSKTWLSDDCNRTDTPILTPSVLGEEGILAISVAVRKRHGHPGGCY
jgi:hypothetical protein